MGGWDGLEHKRQDWLALETGLTFGTIKMDIIFSVTGKGKGKIVWRCNQISKFSGNKITKFIFDDLDFSMNYKVTTDH